jgi:fucose permease
MTVGIFLYLCVETTVVSSIFQSLHFLSRPQHVTMLFNYIYAFVDQLLGKFVQLVNVASDAIYVLLFVHTLLTYSSLYLVEFG